MPNGTGTQAASSVETLSGIFQAKPAGVARRSACEPSRPTVTARSPTAKPWTSAPTSATVPAHWYPTTWGTRARSPPSRFSVSPPSMLTASTSIRMSPGPTLGSGTSS